MMAAAAASAAPFVRSIECSARRSVRSAVVHTIWSRRQERHCPCYISNSSSSGGSLLLSSARNNNNNAFAGVILLRPITDDANNNNNLSTVLLRHDVAFSAHHYCTVLTLNRPASCNALSLDLLQQLEDQLRELDDAYPACRVVVVKAAGSKVFSAGHDLAEMHRILSQQQHNKEGDNTSGGGEAEIRRLFETCSRVMLLLQSIRPVTIASVQGTANAAGCQLVAACDLAIASDTATFALSGIATVGLACSTPMVQVSRAVPHRKLALEMLLTGDGITAEQALARGLINRIVPSSANADATIPLLSSSSLLLLHEETMKLARRIAQHSPHAVAQGKERFYRQLNIGSTKEASAYAVDCIVSDLIVDRRRRPNTSTDAADGIAAFVEKRPVPEWNNNNEWD